VRSVKIFGQELRETQRYAARWSAYHTREYVRDVTWFVGTTLQNLVEVGALLWLMAHLFERVKDGTMTIGTMGLMLRHVLLC